MRGVFTQLVVSAGKIIIAYCKNNNVRTPHQRPGPRKLNVESWFSPGS